jgi:polar amino acid transport system substrate-binding protein
VAVTRGTWREHTILAYLDEPPFCFPAPDGTAAGCDIEVAMHVLSMLGVQSIETRLVTFAELIPGVAAGRWTVNTPLFVTAERAAKVVFSRPAWALADGLLVRGCDAETLTCYEALASDARVIVGVIADQVQERSALAAGVPAGRITRFATQREAVAALQAGKIDAYPSVTMAHRGYLAQRPDSDLTIVDLYAPALAGEGRAAAIGAYSFSRQNNDLWTGFDHALRAFLGTPQHREIMRRYGFVDAEIDRVL